MMSSICLMPWVLAEPQDRSCHRVFNVATMLTRSSFQRILPQPLSKHATGMNSFPIASVARDELHVPRLNSLQAKCFSMSSVLDTAEWKVVDILAEVSEEIDFTEYVIGEPISVRAYSMGTSLDVKTPGKSNCVSYRYIGETPDVILRFDNTKSWKIGLDAICGSDRSCVVVFNDDSVILLDVLHSEINERLEIVKVPASDVDLSSLWQPVDHDILPEEPPLTLYIYREMHKNGTCGWDILLKPK